MQAIYRIHVNRSVHPGAFFLKLSFAGLELWYNVTVLGEGCKP